MTLSQSARVRLPYPS